MLISAASITLAFIVFIRRGHSRHLVIPLLASTLMVVALTAIQIGLSQITGEGVNGAVFYHMRTGLGGGDVTQYAWMMAVSTLVFVLVAAFLVRLRRHISPSTEHRAPFWDSIAGLLILAALAIHPVTTASISYALRFELVEQHEAGFYDPIQKIEQVEAPKNLVILYLESFERTYLDEERFPNLVTRLRALEDQAIAFTNVSQTTGTGFTIGGMVASQCGIPLILSGGANSMQVNQFLSGATCLGDILNEAGYTLSYLGGASIEFAGKGAFYQSHAYEEVNGLEQLLPTLEDPDYTAEWGVQDDTLFDLARERFDQLSNGNEPFVLTMLTLDTHHPGGHANTNRSCAGMTYQDGSNPMLNSVHCVDDLAAAFVEDILSGPNGANTVVAVMSDHLALVNTSEAKLNAGPRRNLMFILDPENDTPKKIDRPATTLDIGPTLLSYLGFDIPRMGFGVDLLGEAPTLPEELGVSASDRRAIDNKLLGYQAVYTRLWDFPDLSDGLYVNLESGEAVFGGSTFKLPAVLSFDEDHAIIQATLGTVRAEETLTRAIFELPKATRYLWLDTCQALSMLSAGAQNSDDEGMCLVSGRRGETSQLSAMTRSSFLSEENLVAQLEAETSSNALAEDQSLILLGQARGELPIHLRLPDLKTGERGVLLQSSAFGSGASFIRRQTSDSLASGEDWILGRGVNLIGIDDQGAAETLARLDQCDPSFAPDSEKSWHEIIETNRNRFVAHVISVHDTAFCGASFTPLSEPLEGLPLTQLKASGMREAYLAVIDRQGQVFEFPNREFSRLQVLLHPRIGDPRPADALLGNKLITPPQQAPALEQPPNLVVVSAATAQNNMCTHPVSAPPTQAALRLLAGNRVTGSALPQAITFTSGWWGQENAGRWAGSLSPELSVILPSDNGTHLALIMELVAAAGAQRDIQVMHGEQELGRFLVSGRSALTLDVSALPRNRPVTLSLLTSGMALGCPKGNDTGNDPRQLNVMLQSVELSELDKAEPAGARAAMLALEMPRYASPSEIEDDTNLPVTELCVSAPSSNEREISIATPLPLNQITSVSDATTQGALAVVDGWWAEEEFGRWTGQKTAEFAIVLPLSPANLELILSTAAFGAIDVEVGLRYEGRLLSRQQTGLNSPLITNVSDLPRDVPITLVLDLLDQPLKCPATQNQADDTRSIGIMLQAVRLAAVEWGAIPASIAHAGGRLNGVALTNSFEALESNLDRFDTFEIDFSWTADEELICLHDWDDSFRSRFGADTDQPLDYDMFRRLLSASAERSRNCDLEGLAGWMRANPDIRIVTDVKNRPLAAHRMIAERHPDLLDQFVPQAFQPEEIDAYNELGFENVIWTLYRYGENLDAIVDAAMGRSLMAITMPQSMAEDGLLRQVTNATGLPVYVHTINDPDAARSMLALGAVGIYSDDLGKQTVARLRQ